MSSSYSKPIGWNTALSSSITASDKVVNLDDYRQSYSLRGDWQNRKIKELEALAKECAQTEGDFNEVSGLRARDFIASLPFDIEPPAIGVEDSGNVLLEWFVKPLDNDPTIFSLVFGKDHFIFSLMAPGKPPFHGALNYSGESMEILILKIKNHFGISQDHARLKTR